MKQWSLNSKIYFVIFLMAMGLCLVSVIGVVQMKNINQNLEVITNDKLPNLMKTEAIMKEFHILNIYERSYVLSEKPEDRKTNLAGIDKHIGLMETVIEARRKVSSVEGLKDLNAFEVAYANWKKFDKEIRDLVEQGQTKLAAAQIIDSGRAIRKAGEEVLENMSERNVKKMNEQAVLAAKTYENAKFMMVMTSILALCSGLALAVMTLREVTKTINQVINSLSENTEQVTAAAGQIAASSEELSQAVTEQASSLEETASSIEEMSSMVQKNAENARLATDIAGGSMATAGQGQKVVVNMIHAIDDINSSNKDIMMQINHSNQQISEIVNVIKEIESKTKVINDIVFQTKLLSFNASVEAARAGEMGKGFAVVAEEVGSLAAMSGNAANEISSLLENSIRKVEAIVKDTKEKVEVLVQAGTIKVDVGTRVAKECGDILDTIVGSTQQVTKMATDISTACQEQSLGVQEITRAMNQLDQVTQINSTTSEEAASAAEQLSAQAVSLKNVVDLLVMTIKGAGSVTAQVRVVPTKSNVIPLRAVTKKVIPVAMMNNSPMPKGNDPRFEEI